MMYFRVWTTHMKKSETSRVRRFRLTHAAADLRLVAHTCEKCAAPKRVCDKS